MKKITFMMVLVLLLNLTGPDVHAQTFEEATDEAVMICTEIDMLLGTGGGVTPAYLATTPLRYQGAILLLRLKGLYDTALAYSSANGFTDTDTFSWIEGRSILNYLFDNQDTIGFIGYPDGTFNPYGEMDVKQYYKVMLVALGYEYAVDFSWDTTPTLPGTLEMAQSVGLLWLQGDTDFIISDLAVATVETLRAPMKGTTQTLVEYLISIGIIDATIAANVGLIDPPSGPPTPIAALSATLPYETAVNLGDSTILISVANATFKPDLGMNTANTTALIAGITGNLGTLNAWNGSVTLDSSNVTRNSNQTLTITLPSSSDYIIGSDETITVVLPTTIFNESIPSPLLAGSFVITDMGTGTIIDPYSIIRPEDFEYISNNADYNYELQQDLDFTAKTLYETESFTGKFNGKNHTISNLTLVADSSTGTGLFNNLTNATVINLVFENGNIEGNNFKQIGFVAGSSRVSTITDVSVTGSTLRDVSTAGFIVGYLSDSLQLSDCVVKNSVIENPGNTSLNKVGGIIGHSDLALGSTLYLYNSNVSGLEITGEKTSNIGGIIGFINGNAIIDDSTVSGAIIGKSYIGGIVGYANKETGTNNLLITNNTSYGNIEGTYYIGGICGGSNNDITITGNHAGLVSLKVNAPDPSTNDAHRVIGRSSMIGIVTLDNTANIGMTRLNELNIDSSDQYVSDRNGLDGESVLMTLIMPLELLYIAQPNLIDPWILELPIPLEELLIDELPFPFPSPPSL